MVDGPEVGHSQQGEGQEGEQDPPTFAIADRIHAAGGDGQGKHVNDHVLRLVLGSEVGQVPASAEGLLEGRLRTQDNVRSEQSLGMSRSDSTIAIKEIVF